MKFISFLPLVTGSFIFLAGFLNIIWQLEILLKISVFAYLISISVFFLGLYLGKSESLEKSEQVS
ncbi:hypothetical protein KKF60_03015 [Patescibacteria group bacterium]|nr:hypothetical protein [Patescibacteria group bacterium]